MKTAIIIPDLHVPYHDTIALTAAKKIITLTQPDTIIYGGDVCDFYAISKFDKNPARLDTLQDDLDKTYEVLDEITGIAKSVNSKVHAYLLEGNHERRIFSYLRRHPEMHSLRCLATDKLLELDKLDIDWMPVEQPLFINKEPFVVTHGGRDDGCKYSQHSAYSAKNTQNKFGVSGVSMHTHRLGSYYRRDLIGQKDWHECGCLCTLNPEWIRKPDWQHGVAIIKYTPKTHHVQLVPIKDGTFMLDGMLYVTKPNRRKMK